MVTLPGPSVTGVKLIRIAFLGLVLGLAFAACARTTRTTTSPPAHSVQTFDTVPSTTVDNSVSTKCAIEDETMVTAFQAYKAENNGEIPSGASGAELAHSLKVAGLLAFDRLSYNDPSQSPAPGHWYYNPTTHDFVRGTGCGDS
jgi:hypothetical protein